MDTNRLEAFSDGVIIILITIMVLDLKVPASGDLAALRSLGPTFFAYILSYVMLGIYWNNLQVAPYGNPFFGIIILVVFGTPVLVIYGAFRGAVALRRMSDRLMAKNPAQRRARLLLELKEAKTIMPPDQLARVQALADEFPDVALDVLEGKLTWNWAGRARHGAGRDSAVVKRPVFPPLVRMIWRSPHPSARPGGHGSGLPLGRGERQSGNAKERLVDLAGRCAGCLLSRCDDGRSVARPDSD